MKKNNPQIPILIREAQGTLPKVFLLRSQYRWRNDELTRLRWDVEFGNEKAQSLEGLSDKQIEETVTGLVKGEA
ncbi:hypothetical protein E4U43_008639 [Claviceps pusilla]|uniref:Ribosomal protein/NADH dehydrogenase domain-containing protein n=1 Tax=Claviceps pusilla TaxID=123648 RepID=A0A9P7NIT2_9HYPO|nr:hypothetical protein E4U43_008639 [Claviceps pusilla]